MVILFVKFRSAMSPAAVRDTMEARLPLFRAQPGLVQKYYAHEPTSGEWSGIYLWDSHEALTAFRASELARSIPAAYQVVGAPRTEVLEVLFPLRPEVPVGTSPPAAERGVAADEALRADLLSPGAAVAPAI